MEPTIRLERMTPSLQVRSSTTELSGLKTIKVVQSTSMQTRLNVVDRGRVELPKTGCKPAIFPLN